MGAEEGGIITIDHFEESLLREKRNKKSKRTSKRKCKRKRKRNEKEEK